MLNGERCARCGVQFYNYDPCCNNPTRSKDGYVGALERAICVKKGVINTIESRIVDLNKQLREAMFELAKLNEDLNDLSRGD